MAGGNTHRKKSCACCKEYLEHLGGKMRCFLRRMAADSMHSMIMPDRFVSHFGGKIPGTIKLESPNGILYVVEVTECMNKTLLQCGWEAFVDAHNIKEGESLLFRHIENSRYEVLILDSDDCEKVFSCAGTRNGSCVQDKTVDPVDSSGSSSNDTTQSSRSRNTENLTAMCSSSEKSGEDSPSGYEFHESVEPQTPSGSDYVLSRRTYLSEAQKERVVAHIQDIQPEITVFVAVMKKCNLQSPAPYLVISSRYASVHFPRETATITLQRPSKRKKWYPRFYKRIDKSDHMLRGQWQNFVHDNCLQEEDICLFVPTKGGRNFVFTVHLLQAEATHSRDGTDVHKIGSSQNKRNSKMASQVHIKEAPGGDVSSESNKHGVSHESLESEDSDGPSEPPYISSMRRRLSQLQKKTVEEKVRAIQSEIPICVATISKLAGSGGKGKFRGLELSSRYAASYLPDKNHQTLVLQCKGMIWQINLVVRRRYTKGKRWFLTAGWRKFAHDNRLRVGDFCLFELKKKKLTMEVHIISNLQRYPEVE
ncbi:B3 domain-containing protein Os03g0619800 [Oryza glaberrima]|uniref:TF-B3 domain-containing protein n=1 Tax=Oryza glaberrima TaxID=4538 RepID=I1PDJ0_ORYGL|nr:B3 domain-containing protein Os03g0619800 [Oryza glaberrima]XP_052149360.1 B3 domain-containing protein Os03g0619800 [Oryza glaberrima]